MKMRWLVVFGLVLVAGFVLLGVLCVECNRSFFAPTADGALRVVEEQPGAKLADMADGVPEVRIEREPIAAVPPAPKAEASPLPAVVLPTRTIVVRVLDVNGTVLREGCRVEAQVVVQGEEDRGAIRETAKVNPETGIARFAELPAAQAHLKAHVQGVGWLQGPTVEVIAGTVVEAEIHYDGPDPSRRIAVNLWCRRFPSLNTFGGTLRLSSNGVLLASLKQEGPFAEPYAFDDLNPGQYTVEFEHPGFEFWSKSQVEPGEVVWADLRCNAGLLLSVSSGQSLVPIDSYTLELRLDGSNSYPNLYELLKEGDPVPDRGLFDELPPNLDCTLIVRVEGFSEKQLPLPALHPRELRQVEVQLVRGGRVAGVVLLADGATPVSDATVQLLPVGNAPRHIEPGVFTPGSVATRTFWATTNAEGQFSIPGVAPGAWSLHAFANSWVVTTIDELVVLDGSPVENVRVLLPPTARLEGRLICPNGLFPQALRLTLSFQAKELVRSAFVEEFLELEVKPDGSFRSVPLPLGKAWMHFRAPDISEPNNYMNSFTNKDSATLIDTLDLVPGVNHRDFDLREQWPGSLRIRATSAGAPLVGYVVTLQGPGAKGRPSAAASTDAGGAALVPFLSVGEHRVGLRPLGGEWFVQMPKPVAIRANELTETEIDVLLGAGSILVVDRKTGAPAANRSVRILFDGGEAHTHQLDEEGRLNLVLPVGSHELVSDADPRPIAPNLEWTRVGPGADAITVSFP